LDEKLRGRSHNAQVEFIRRHWDQKLIFDSIEFVCSAMTPNPYATEFTRDIGHAASTTDCPPPEAVEYFEAWREVVVAQVKQTGLPKIVLFVSSVFTWIYDEAADHFAELSEEGAKRIWHARQDHGLPTAGDQSNWTGLRLTAASPTTFVKAANFIAEWVDEAKLFAPEDPSEALEARSGSDKSASRDEIIKQFKPDSKTQEAAAYIIDYPGQKGDVIARDIGVEPETFRKNIVPELTKYGFWNAKPGYYPPTTARTT
jgi:hypothetical protein